MTGKVKRGGSRKSVEDHRVRVGRERRKRQRKHLLDSVLYVCSNEAGRAQAGIDDVVTHAAVSRGTFYTYFESMDQAIAELGAEMAVEMTEGISEVYDVLDDPVMRTATGFELFLLRAMVDRRWGAFIARMGLLREGDLFSSKIRSDIEMGIETGDYSVEDVRTASDLLMGATVEGILRICQGESSIAYIKTMAVMVLCSFGVSQSKARKTADRAFDRIAAEAPGALRWWPKDENF